MRFPVPHPLRGPGKSSGRGSSPLPKATRPVTRAVLDNGLNIFLVRAPDLPVVSHWIWYTVGSRDERSGETGLSHFLEHMMFKGTRKYPKGSIDAITSRLGGFNNAMTTHDYTAYFFNLRGDRWEEALKIEANRMRGCLLDEKEFELEKQVVIEELQLGRDEPWYPLFEAVEASAFHVHPYHHPVIGWREDLERLTREGMLDYYRRHYGPDRANLVLVGDFDKKEALALCRKHLERIPPCKEPRREVLREPPQDGERRVTLRFPGNMHRLAIAWKSFEMGTREDVVLDVASFLLSSGRSSRLYKGLVKGREIASFAQTYNEARLDPGLFWVLSEPKPGVDPKDLEAAVLEECHRLRDEGPKADELRRVKKAILTSFWFDMETVSEQANRIGRAQVGCRKGFKVLRDYPEGLRSVTAREVREVLRKVMHEDRRTVGWSRPEDV